jgi:hypothetical protein
MWNQASGATAGSCMGVLCGVVSCLLLPYVLFLDGYVNVCNNFKRIHGHNLNLIHCAWGVAHPDSALFPPPVWQQPSCNSHSGGRSSALAMSTLFTTFVLMPLPRPSIYAHECMCQHRQSSADAAGQTREPPAIPWRSAWAFYSGRTHPPHSLRRCSASLRCFTARWLSRS